MCTITNKSIVLIHAVHVHVRVSVKNCEDSLYCTLHMCCLYVDMFKLHIVYLINFRTENFCLI